MRIKVAIVVLLLAITLGVVGAGVVYTTFNPTTNDPAVEEVDCTMTVMSFNVRTVNFEFNKNPNDDIELRSPLMLKKIAEVNPDLIGMQEYLFGHETFMKPELLKTYDFVGESRDGSFFGEMSAIYYKKERFELIDSYTYWVSETPEKMSLGWDATIYRVCTVAILKDKLNDKVIQFGNVHLDHIAKLARENGTKLVIDRAVQSEYPAIQVGDFNYGITNKNYKYCTENMDDTRLVAPGAITTSSYNGWNEETINDGGSPIDHIFVTKNDFNVYSYKVHAELIDGLFASDHFPVVAKIELKQTIYKNEIALA